MAFEIAGRLLVRRTEGKEPRSVCADLFTTLHLKLSLVPETMPVQDVQRGEWGNFQYDGATIEIVQRGTLFVEYENPGDGDRVRANIDCGIVPPRIKIAT